LNCIFTLSFKGELPVYTKKRNKESGKGWVCGSMYLIYTHGMKKVQKKIHKDSDSDFAEVRSDIKTLSKKIDGQAAELKTMRRKIDIDIKMLSQRIDSQATDIKALSNKVDSQAVDIKALDYKLDTQMDLLRREIGLIYESLRTEIIPVLNENLADVPRLRKENSQTKKEVEKIQIVDNKVVSLTVHVKENIEPRVVKLEKVYDNN
jgi:septal ring factor EnvC (AmiA/AmiB activator)